MNDIEQHNLAVRIARAQLQARSGEMSSEDYARGMAAIPVEKAQKGPIESAIGGAIIAVVVVGALLLALLFYVAVFILSPGILAAMLLLGSVGWVAGVVSSLVIAAMAFGGIYAYVRNVRRTALAYAGVCVLATAVISLSGGLGQAEDFLRGRYYGMSVLTRISNAIPSMSSSTSGPVPTLDEQLAAQRRVNAEEKPRADASAASSPAPVAVVPPSAPATITTDPAAPVAAVPKQPDQIPVPAATDGNRETVQSQLATPEPAQAVHSDEPTGPSFDCTKATTFAEKSVCGSPALARLDQTLHDAYVVARQGSQGPRVQDDQKLWVQQRARCRDDACLADMYKIRIRQLASYKR